MLVRLRNVLKESAMERTPDNIPLWEVRPHNVPTSYTDLLGDVKYWFQDGQQSDRELRDAITAQTIHVPSETASR